MVRYTGFREKQSSEERYSPKTSIELRESVSLRLILKDYHGNRYGIVLEMEGTVRFINYLWLSTFDITNQSKFKSRFESDANVLSQFKCFKDFLFATAARIYFWIP